MRRRVYGYVQHLAGIVVQGGGGRVAVRDVCPGRLGADPPVPALGCVAGDSPVVEEAAPELRRAPEALAALGGRPVFAVVEIRGSHRGQAFAIQPLLGRVLPRDRDR